MDTLRRYLNQHTPQQQEAFARACGTSLNYLRKALSTGQKLGEGLCIRMDRESCGEVTCESLRPDVDWAYLRAKPAVEATA